ncbi:UNVERIFIED_CONTAM: hypothetical protein Sindi_0020400 [Sesamum indicum]
MRSEGIDKVRVARGRGKNQLYGRNPKRKLKCRTQNFVDHLHLHPKSKGSEKHGRRRRSMKVVYGKGIACVSGDTGIGKTEQSLLTNSIKEIDIGVEGSAEKGRTKSFAEQEEAAIARVRKELMRNIPFLVIVDNLKSEKDWWDHKLVKNVVGHEMSRSQAMKSGNLIFGGIKTFLNSIHSDHITNKPIFHSFKIKYVSIPNRPQQI